LKFYQLQKDKKYEESEQIFSKFLLPIHQRFSNHKVLFRQFPCLTLEAKIKLYTLKILKNLEDAKYLSKTEKSENDNMKLTDEIYLQNNDIDNEALNTEISALHSINLDYETIHSEILENIILDENDSGVSDFDDYEEEPKDDNQKQDKIFNIIKIKNIIHKSVASLFEEEQQKDEFKPLVELEKEIKKSNIEEKDKKEDIMNNTELKTQDNTIKFPEDEILKEDTINKCDIVNNKEKDEEDEEEIINYKKYENHLEDPYSNFNNFTKKYEVKINPKKRFRDIHPFLKTFNPKFLKKENIDKKIFRRFRKFVRLLYKKNRNFPIFIRNPVFWKKFYVKNLLPPVKIILNQNGQIIEHKSFNTQYLIWLFKQEGTTELFEMFIKNESENVINNFVEEYDLSKSEEPNIIEKLKEYMKYIPEIYTSKDDNNKIVLEENKENFETNFLKNKDDEDIESINSIESNSNPFNLKFDEIEKKNFKEIPYDDSAFIDNNNSFYSEKFNNFNGYLTRRRGSQFFKFNYLYDDFFEEKPSRVYFK